MLDYDMKDLEVEYDYETEEEQILKAKLVMLNDNCAAVEAQMFEPQRLVVNTFPNELLNDAYAESLAE